MKIAIVSGSHREKSESLRVSQYFKHCLENLNIDSKILSLENNPIPLWTSEAWNPKSAFTKTFKPYSDALLQADGLIFVVPEWNGMVTPSFKNFLLLCHKNEIAHKPALITAVSSGRGGSYPISELRMSGYKNNRVCYIPEHLIIRNVTKMFQDYSKSASEEESYIRKRIDFTLDILIAYTESLKPMRENKNLIDANYPNGM
jgi:multimeric flavodoxin WrbA